MYIACEYCGKVGVFSNNCNCSNEIVRNKIIELEKNIARLEDQVNGINGICVKLHEAGVNPKLIEELWNVVEKRANYTYFNWLKDQSRYLGVMAEISELFGKRKCKSVMDVDGTSRRFTSIELLNEIRLLLLTGRSEDEKRDWPKMTVFELIDEINKDLKEYNEKEDKTLAITPCYRNLHENL